MERRRKHRAAPAAVRTDGGSSKQIARAGVYGTGRPHHTSGSPILTCGRASRCHDGQDYRVGYGLGVLDRESRTFELGVDVQRVPTRIVRKYTVTPRGRSLLGCP